MLGELREAVARTARELSAAGMVVEAQGNVSARAGDGLAVTAAGTLLGTITADQVSVVDLDGALLHGPPPSTELRVHLGVYAAFPETHAVVHGHALPPAGTAPVAPFAPEGTRELADNVVAAMHEGPLVVMERHGTVARGASLAEALALATSSVAR